MPAPVRTRCRIERITDHGGDIYTVRFTVAPKISRFKAGQFLHLTLEEFDPSEGFWPESRVFSIASKPGADFIEIVYSVKGSYTRRMCLSLREGMDIWLKLPYGDFIVERYLKEGQPGVFIAGGTGISPFIPYFLQLLDRGCRLPLRIYYGIRDAEHFLYQEVIEAMRTIAEVEVVEGLFNLRLVSREVFRIDGAVCFLSGPPAMIKAFQDGLKYEGFPQESVIIDAWE